MSGFELVKDGVTAAFVILCCVLLLITFMRGLYLTGITYVICIGTVFLLMMAFSTDLFDAGFWESLSLAVFLYLILPSIGVLLSMLNNKDDDPDKKED